MKTLVKKALAYGGYEIHKVRDPDHEFFKRLIQRTNNFGKTKWLGHPIWQNVLDLWTIQETIAEVRPELLIECGTNRGGSAIFYANLFDLMGYGRVVTVDIERMHNLTHPRITFLIGSSSAAETVDRIQSEVAQTTGPVMVILDSDHRPQHVAREIELYAPFVTPGSYMLVQDGVIDVLYDSFAGAQPGPLSAIENFLANDDRFELDLERTQRFIITHHPKGWLKRLPT